MIGLIFGETDFPKYIYKKIKGKKKYLQVNEIKTIMFRDKILKDSKKKKIIGISWISKSPTHKNKSISLEKFIFTIFPVSSSISLRPSIFHGFKTRGFSQITSDPDLRAKRIWLSCK